MTASDMRADALFDTLIQEADQPFSGWNFGYLSSRWVEAPLPWSYPSQALQRIKQAETLLDMDTGGGEKLALWRPLPARTYATEAYKPNIAVARERLEPLGVEVVAIENDDNSDLPFDDGTFDLILNRHGAYSPPEIERILKPGGVFMTQQVGYRDLADLAARFGVKPGLSEEEWQLSKAREALVAAGLAIVDAQEDAPVGRIYDVGAIVYFYKAIPWAVPDFSIEKYREQLRAIHEQIQRGGYIEMTNHRFFLIAEKSN